MGRLDFIPADTSPEAYEAQNEAYRRMGGTGRTAVMFRLIELARENAKAGIRARHPDYDEDHVHHAFLRLRLGDDLVREIWPDRELTDP
jgi:hypothetical protein